MYYLSDIIEHLMHVWCLIRARNGSLRHGHGEREGAEWVVREGVGAGGRNDPSLVCTYE
jgi:hypothetical protein